MDVIFYNIVFYHTIRSSYFVVNDNKEVYKNLKVSGRVPDLHTTAFIVL
jgi:hypothetical protein